MENHSEITVLCSTYNSAKWIDGYLKSINKQMLKTFNIIFVDANSDDGSLETIKDFTFRDGITVEIVEYAEKIPIYEAWNCAIHRCNTEYVINVNTDDRLYPSALKTYLGYAEAEPSGDIFYCTYVQVDDVTHERLSGFFQPPEHDHNLLIQQCYGGPFPMLKRDTLIEEGLFNPEYDISGDYEMWLRMSKNNRNFVRVAESLGSYYRNPQGVSTNRENHMRHVQQDLFLRELYR
tara:strand:- start:341 stop:1045 length:705 start_codon:yes stop_codon:yes gene_type:complete